MGSLGPHIALNLAKPKPKPPTKNKRLTKLPANCSWPKNRSENRAPPPKRYETTKTGIPEARNTKLETFLAGALYRDFREFMRIQKKDKKEGRNKIKKRDKERESEKGGGQKRLRSNKGRHSKISKKSFFRGKQGFSIKIKKDKKNKNKKILKNELFSYQSIFWWVSKISFLRQLGPKTRTPQNTIKNKGFGKLFFEKTYASRNGHFWTKKQIQKFQISLLLSFSSLQPKHKHLLKPYFYSVVANRKFLKT